MLQNPFTIDTKCAYLFIKALKLWTTDVHEVLDPTAAESVGESILYGKTNGQNWGLHLQSQT